MHDVSSGEIARLIGECPIGWEPAGRARCLKMDPIPALSELLRASKVPLAVFRDRFARSAFYDPHYRIMVIAAVLSIVGKSDALRGQRSIQGKPTESCSSLSAVVLGCLAMVQEWSRTRRSGRFSDFFATAASPRVFGRYDARSSSKSTAGAWRLAACRWKTDFARLQDL